MTTINAWRTDAIGARDVLAIWWLAVLAVVNRLRNATPRPRGYVGDHRRPADGLSTMEAVWLASHAQVLGEIHRLHLAIVAAERERLAAPPAAPTRPRYAEWKPAKPGVDEPGQLVPGEGDRTFEPVAAPEAAEFPLPPPAPELLALDAHFESAGYAALSELSPPAGLPLVRKPRPATYQENVEAMAAA